MRPHRMLIPALLITSLVAAGAAAQTARVYSAPSAGVLRGGGDQPRAVLGLSIGASTSVRDTLGLLVTSVTTNGPAERAGIQEGDRIASINGVNLRLAPADAGDFDVDNTMSRRLTRELSKLRPGDDVDLRVYSEGRTRTVHIRTADSDSLYTRRRVSRNEMSDRPTLGLGIGATSSRRDTLGILVMFVDDSGPAARAGIEEGNRIAAIDDIDLRAGRDDAGDEFIANSKIRRLQREVSKLRPGDNVDLRVYANGDYRTVRVRVARASDLPRRRGFIISGDGMGMGMGMGMMPGAMPLDFDGAIIGEQVRAAIERAMSGAGRALEGVGRGLSRSRQWQDDEELPKKRVEPIEPIRIEPLEPSRMRRLAPMKVPFTTVLLDDSSISAPMIAAKVAVDRGRGENPSALNIAGLRMVAVGKELATYLGKGSERGLLVIDVPQWAASALRPGDVVLSVDGSRVRADDGSDEVTVALPRLREAQLDILRDGVHHSVTLPARR
ncbi:MAG TPA: PDZ domain-containing protein [Gemmatimonadaceae bacterium]|nr:PDZ domain-containing protein [Gemmatimonadaceae bacterium]